MSGQRDRMNRVSGALTDSGTTVTFEFALKQIAENTRLSIDLEEMHVWETSGTGAGADATVQRGFNGSTAAVHDSGALVRVNPRFTDFEILRAVNDELRDLSSPDNGLFRVLSDDFDFNAATFGYELTAPTGIISIWRVRFDPSGPESDWPVIPKRYWRLDQAADTDEFSSGLQLVLKAAAEPGRPVRVSYKTGFASLSAMDEDVTSVSGLHAEAHDILPMGAAIRLMAGRDLKRSFMEAQPEPRRSDEVDPGSAQQAMRPLLAMRLQRIMAEVSRLMSRFPEAIE